MGYRDACHAISHVIIIYSLAKDSLSLSLSLSPPSNEYINSAVGLLRK